MGFSYSEEERLLRDTLRRVAESELAPRAQHIDTERADMDRLLDLLHAPRLAEETNRSSEGIPERATHGLAD